MKKVPLDLQDWRQDALTFPPTPTNTIDRMHLNSATWSKAHDEILYSMIEALERPT